jgi:MOSC domain-containing protein YiiM
MSMTGRLDAIYIKRMKLGPMDPVGEAELIAGKGIVGNANQGGHRQVTIIEKEVWNKMMDHLDSDLPPTTRRANLLVEGIQLAETRGKTLRIGNCRIRIHGETIPCERMDEALPGLKDEMEPEWRGGAFGEVLDDGHVTVGDPVEWTDQ